MTIYVLQQGKRGPVKIGFTNGDVLQRCSNVQVSSHKTLILKGILSESKVTEEYLHRQFAKDRLHGEWFRPSAGIRDFIRTLDPPPIRAPRPKRKGRVLSTEDALKIAKRGGKAKGDAMAHKREGIAEHWVIRNVANCSLTWDEKVEIFDGKISESTMRRRYYFGK